jgi:formylglycine-generating enzyme required for sulfatase activity
MSLPSPTPRPATPGNYRVSTPPTPTHVLAGNVNNWVADWYWDAFGRYCVGRGLPRGPVLGDELRQALGAEEITEKVDRGGGFATPMEYHEVVGCTRKVHWPPEAREPWNGFRTAADEGAL